MNEKKTKYLEIGKIKASRYRKEDDPDAFQRYRITGKTIVDGAICQLNGYLTQIKNQTPAEGA